MATQRHRMVARYAGLAPASSGRGVMMNSHLDSAAQAGAFVRIDR